MESHHNEPRRLLERRLTQSLALRLALGVFLAALTGMSTGCGTLYSVLGGEIEPSGEEVRGPRIAPYGGVRYDTDLLGSGYLIKGRSLLAWPVLFDVPLSLAGDTLVLPYTLPRWYFAGGDDEARDADVVPAGDSTDSG